MKTVGVLRSSSSAFERQPHLAGSLGGPDAEVELLGRFIVGARRIERHVMIQMDEE
jgi:hypothetical protein